MDSEVISLREQYYQAIFYLQNKNDIMKALPSIEYKNFFPIMSSLIKRIKKATMDAREMLEDESIDSEMREYIEEEIGGYLLKEEACHELYQKANSIKEMEKEAEKTPVKHLVFAKTSSGRVYLEKDLANIPEEYYTEVRESLRKVQEGITENNSTQARYLGSNNLKLNGIHEIKYFKLRLIYKNLAPDVCYVIRTRQKKSDWSSIDQRDLVSRSKETNDEFLSLKEKMNDEIFKMQLIEENEKIKDDIIRKINNNKRGDRYE